MILILVNIILYKHHLRIRTNANDSWKDKRVLLHVTWLLH